MKQRPAERRIIVNADDLGLCASVNTAIFEVFRAGNLNSATLMVNMPGTHDAVRRLRDHEGLAVGLHFCIAEGTALSGPSSLTDGDGAFFDRTALAVRTLRNQVEAVDVRREFEAQLAKTAELGVRITHCDSHQHTMMLPAIMDAIAPAAIERGLPVRLVEPPPRAVIRAWRRPTKILKQLLNNRLSRRHRKKYRFQTNDALVSVHDLESTGPYGASVYHAMLEDAAHMGVTEVMVHSYPSGDELQGTYLSDGIGDAAFIKRCMSEYEALRGARVFGEYRMTTYDEL